MDSELKHCGHTNTALIVLSGFKLLGKGVQIYLLVPFKGSFPPHLTISWCALSMWVFGSWYTIAKTGNARFYPFADFIQHGSKVLEITALVSRQIAVTDFSQP